MRFCKKCKKELIVGKTCYKLTNLLCKKHFRLLSKADYIKHRAERRLVKEKYEKINNKTLERKMQLNEIKKRMDIKHPKKLLARLKFREALRTGKIKKQLCAICGNAKVHGHHINYNKPLEVIWLCSKHHGEIHRKYDKLEISHP
jgi:hypothetical protein